MSHQQLLCKEKNVNKISILIKIEYEYFFVVDISNFLIPIFVNRD